MSLPIYNNVNNSDNTINDEIYSSKNGKVNNTMTQRLDLVAPSPNIYTLQKYIHPIVTNQTSPSKMPLSGLVRRSSRSSSLSSNILRICNDRKIKSVQCSFAKRMSGVLNEVEVPELYPSIIVHDSYGPIRLIEEPQQS